jgi:hypothetical protein
MKKWTMALILAAGCGTGEPPAKPPLPTRTTAAQPTPPSPPETAPPPKAPEGPRDPAPLPAAAPAPAYTPVASKAGRSVDGQNLREVYLDPVK